MDPRPDTADRARVRRVGSRTAPWRERDGALTQPQLFFVIFRAMRVVEPIQPWPQIRKAY